MIKTDSENSERSPKFDEKSPTSPETKNASSFMEMEKFYGEYAETKNLRCLISEKSSRKIKWDIFIALLLIMVCMIIPFRLAFSDDESLEWDIAYYVMDFFFLLDMILSFFTTYSDPDKATEIADRKEIAVYYVKSWFFIDLISIIPFDLALSSLQ